MSCATRLKVKSPEEAVGFEVAVKGGRKLGAVGMVGIGRVSTQNQSYNVTLK